MKTNLKKLWKISKSQAQPLLGSRLNLSQLPFMTGYLENTQAFDRNIALRKGFFQPLWNLDEEDTEENVLTQWRLDCYGFFLKNYQNLNRLYELMLKEYEPLENYNMKENYTDTDSGSDTITNVLGERARTEDLGSSTDTVNYGQDKVTDVVGNKSITDNIGARSDSTTYGTDSTTKNFGAKSGTNSDKISGFNSSSYVNSTQSTDNEQAYTDSETRQSRTDNESIGAQSNTHTEATYTDTHTKDAKVDSTQHSAKTNLITEEEATDTNTTDYGKVTTHIGSKAGNLGVTTSQQMAQSEVELWTNFKFYDILVDMLCTELCGYCEEDM